ncbi:HNH endonuclease [Corticibacter populi]|uniref:HNH endonuclease n=1 Tax=Corticibacter populi TaxID=1550736 RepID=A0A3M6QZA4_9BURK|nr:HNH endonuclease signature motif containing protein [Corticibacter populi]RMX07959.1 HNH endonuclease [Corticibacter populi]RZS35200.1 HNH endonuclease [Corticibacter populi]
MAISDNTVKLLWGRAAGTCSNPICRTDLTVLLEDGRGFNVGEMAHVIASSPNGPRGVGTGGSDEYENLVLLCPTCHRTVDKAPAGTYPVSMLHQWKQDHESSIRSNGTALKFQSVAELKIYVARLLYENKVLWSSFGPQSLVAQADPGSNMYEVWVLRKLDTIVPNNTKIINAVEANITLLNSTETASFFHFKIHAQAFERHQYTRLDTYPMFPAEFEKAMLS